MGGGGRGGGERLGVTQRRVGYKCIIFLSGCFEIVHLELVKHELIRPLLDPVQKYEKTNKKTGLFELVHLALVEHELTRPLIDSVQEY